MDRARTKGERRGKSRPRLRQRLARVRSRRREILRFQSGHRIELYSRGRVAIDDMIEAIDRAEHHVHLETYILRADETGRRVLSHLEACASRGVAVRIIIDAIGSRGLDRRALEPLLRAGGRIVEFNPPSQWLTRFRPRQRDHRKLLIVDSAVAFLGGLNLGDEYVQEDAQGPRWRDAHLRLEGPGLTELQALFVENWFRCDGESFEWRTLVATDRRSKGDRSVAILADGPMYPRRRLRSFFLEELERARSRILLVTPYFAPGTTVLDALGDASDRGVRVELLIAGHSDHPILRRAAREFVPRLLQKGVRVFEDPHRMMHAKLAVFDDSLSVVGTSNLDRQSLHHSCEVNAVIEGHETADWILEHFGTDVFDVSPIDQALLARRAPSTRMVDRLAAIAARMM